MRIDEHLVMVVSRMSFECSVWPVMVCDGPFHQAPLKEQLSVVRLIRHCISIAIPSSEDILLDSALLLTTLLPTFSHNSYT